MKNISFKTYVNKDKPFFKKLLKVYLSNLNNININNKKFELILKSFLKNKTKKKFLIFYKNKVIGFFILVYSKNVFNKKICLISDFYIERRYRGFKMGSFIISILLRKLKKINFKEIRINILSRNLSINKFWKNFKFKEKSRNYVINL